MIVDCDSDTYITYNVGIQLQHYVALRHRIPHLAWISWQI